MKSLITAFIILVCVTAKAQEQWVLKSGYLTKSDTVLIYKPSGYNETKKYPLVIYYTGTAKIIGNGRKPQICKS